MASGTQPKLTFSDDFASFDQSKWGTAYPWDGATGGTNATNNEQQWYLNGAYAASKGINTYDVHDGVLDIHAAKTPSSISGDVNGYDYTSGMINSKQSFSQTYGYFEMRAELPAGKGMWPAFWLLPEKGGWPPEIDVMETIGSQPNTLNTTAHYGTNNQSQGHQTTQDGLTTGYHTYGVDWEADKISWYLDGKQVYQVDTPADMHQPMYMLANLAVGGSWPGSPDASTQFPSTMSIDYIKAYSAMPTGGTANGDPSLTTEQQAAAATHDPATTGSTTPAAPPSAGVSPGSAAPAPDDPATGQPASGGAATSPVDQAGHGGHHGHHAHAGGDVPTTSPAEGTGVVPVAPSAGTGAVSPVAASGTGPADGQSSVPHPDPVATAPSTGAQPDPVATAPTTGAQSDPVASAPATGAHEGGGHHGWAGLASLFGGHAQSGFDWSGSAGHGASDSWTGMIQDALSHLGGHATGSDVRDPSAIHAMVQDIASGVSGQPHDVAPTAQDHALHGFDAFSDASGLHHLLHAQHS